MSNTLRITCLAVCVLVGIVLYLTQRFSKKRPKVYIYVIEDPAGFGKKPYIWGWLEVEFAHMKTHPKSYQHPSTSPPGNWEAYYVNGGASINRDDIRRRAGFEPPPADMLPAIVAVHSDGTVEGDVHVDFAGAKRFIEERI